MRPTDEQIAEAKATAAKVDRQASILDLEDFDLAAIFRDLTAEEYAEWLDLSQTNRENASSFALAKVLLWPKLDEARALMPAFGSELLGLVLKRAGMVKDKALVEPATVERMVAEGVPQDVAESLAKANTKKGALSLFRMPAQNVVAVLTRPSAESFDATVDAEQEAAKSGVGRFAVAFAAVKDSLAWSNRPLETILDKTPALIIDLKAEYARLGGSAAKATVKSL
ncbi:MAG TPA: hypothetical protein VGQ38_15350 [Gaiellaceae bacterium]|jgi:hypothetical protein|nr:hypothetical protein [Gaiellaceae bacterium]